MWGSVKVKTRPAALPLDVAALRSRLRLDDTGDVSVDAAEREMIEDFARQAVAMIDGPDGIGVAMMRQVWTLTLDAWPRSVDLPGGSVSHLVAIRYLAADGSWQAIPVDAVRLVAGTDPARVVPMPGARWPTAARGPGVIEIDYALGVEDPAAVDQSLVAAVSLLVGHYYENREAVTTAGTPREIPLGAAHIMDRHRRGVVAG